LSSAKLAKRWSSDPRAGIILAGSTPGPVMSLPTIDARTTWTQAFPSLETLGGRRLQWLLVALLATVALLNGVPHLREPIWQDEAATLELYASQGLAHPFTHYTSPNNHMAFSAMLYLWQRVVPAADEAWLRLLPLGMFVLTVPIVFASAKRMAGVGAAVLAALLFASAGVSGNFATQLRGYAPSWLFVSLCLLCALNVLATRRRWAWQGGYVAATLCAVGTVPTNVFLVQSVGVAVALVHLLDERNRTRAGWLAVGLLVLAPPLALLLAYARVWDELMHVSSLLGSGWTRVDLLRNWWHGTMSDFRWLLPVAVVAIALRLARRDPARRSSPAREWLLPSLLLAGLVVAVAIIPRAPFPRSLVPYLPAWYCGVAALATPLLRPLLRTPARTLGLVALAALGLGLSSASATPTCRAQGGPGGKYEYDLCHQYFRDRYHPRLVIEAWAALRRPQVPIATNYEGYYALRAQRSRATIFEYRSPPKGSSTLPLVVAHDDAEMRRIRDSLGLQQVPYALEADTGWFKVYAPARP
jgi:hypothetical protein